MERLSETNEVIFFRLLGMRYEAFHPAAGDHSHAAGCFGCIGQRHLGGHMFRRIEVEIVVILVPRNVGLVPRFLDIHRGVIDQNIGADDIFDRIQHLGMMDNPIRPLEQQI